MGRLEEHMGKLEHRMDGLQLRMDRQEKRLENLELKVGSIEEKVYLVQLRLIDLDSNYCAYLKVATAREERNMTQYNEVKKRFDMVDERLGTIESVQAETNRKLEALTETVNEHHVSINELVEYRMRG